MRFLQFTLIFSLLFSAQLAFAKGGSLCDILDGKACQGVSKMARRSSARSMPTTTTASQFNPANVSHDRGFGLEVFYQPGNPFSFGLITGTGKTGAAMMTANNENAFFGNRTIELDSEFLKRHDDDKQYVSNKYAAGFGIALYKNRTISLDLGVISKYHTKVKRINPGGGAALRVGPFSLGAAMYKDDAYLDFKDTTEGVDSIPYRLIFFPKTTYHESYTVRTMSAGVKLWNLFLAWGSIKTKYKFYEDGEVDISIYSASFVWDKFLLSYGLRDEKSPGLKYVEGKLEAKEKIKANYFGLQYSLTRYCILGLHHNYYLLDEVAGSVAVFF